MNESTRDTLWFALIVGGAVGGFAVTLALSDPWWLLASLVVVLIGLTAGPFADRDGRE